MSRVILVFFLVLISAIAHAGRYVIVSLPDTVYQNEHSGDLWDTITFSYPTMTSVGSGLYLAGSGSVSPPRYWLIDLQGGAIEFGTGDGNNLHGIKIFGGSSTHQPRYIKIQNGTINHKPTHSRSSDTTIVRDNLCISPSGHDITISNINMMIDGYNGKCITGSGYDVEISGGHYKSLVNYFRSRCQVDAGIIKFDQTFNPVFASDSGYTFCQKIHGIRIDSCPHMGIRLDGGNYSDYGIFKIYACTIMVDSRNLLYTSYTGTCASSANPYAIALQYPGPGSDIYNNLITSGSNYDGGRGLLIESSAGTASSSVLIHDNYIDIHEGPDAEYDETHVENHALRVRNDCEYLHIYGNTIINTGDANTGTPSYARGISSLRYTFEGTYGGVSSHCIIENNILRAKSLTSGVTAYGVCFDAVLIEDTTLAFRFNRIESDNILVKFGEINQGARGIRLLADTLKFLSPSYNPQTYHVGHLCNNFDCSNNLAKDMIYQSGASDTNIVISCTVRGSRELGLQRILRTRILGNNGYPVPDAMIWVVNNYHDTVLTGLSPRNGVFGGSVTYWWESDVAADSTTFNNFLLKVKKGTDSISVPFSVSATSLMPTAILSKTPGDSTVCDTCLFICGDVDGNGYANASDIAYLIRYIYRHGPPPVDYEAADVDNSGVINILDVTYFLNAYYKSGPSLHCR